MKEGNGMKEVKCKMFYAGQGALNCVWTEEHEEDVVKVFYAAIIDCGAVKSHAVFKNIEEKSLETVCDIANHAEHFDFMITHPHADHINLIPKIIEKVDKPPHKIYIGGCEGIRFNQYLSKILKNEIKYEYFGEKSGAVSLTGDVYGHLEKEYNLRISIMISNFGNFNKCIKYTGTGYEIINIPDYNSNSAIYGFQTSNEVFIFTGDITGLTVKNIINVPKYISFFSNFIKKEETQVNRDLFLTIPHHGSHTLVSAYKKCDFKQVFKHIDVFLTQCNLKEGHYFASAGLHSNYLHPEFGVLVFFAMNAKTLGQRFTMNGYKAYMHNCHYYDSCKADKDIKEIITSNLDVPPGDWRLVNPGYRALYSSIYQDENKKDTAFTYSTNAFQQEIIGAHEIVCNASENSDTYKIISYDHLHRPYYTDTFKRISNALGESVCTREYHQHLGG